MFALISNRMAIPAGMDLTPAPIKIDGLSPNAGSSPPANLTAIKLEC